MSLQFKVQLLIPQLLDSSFLGEWYWHHSEMSHPHVNATNPSRFTCLQLWGDDYEHGLLSNNNEHYPLNVDCVLNFLPQLGGLLPSPEINTFVVVQ